MDVIQFSIDGGLFPLYRSVSPGEASVLLSVLGEGFVLPVAEGDPMDNLLFDVLAASGVSSELYFAAPPEAHVVGTFELRDSRDRAGPARQGRCRPH